MSKRRKRLALFAVGLAAVVAAFWFANREPKYHGRTLSQWFAAARADGADAATLEEFNTAVFVLGTNDFARLVEWVAFDVNQCLPQKLFNILPGSVTPQSALEYLLDKKWNADASATDAGDVFRLLGPHGAPAIPGLTKIAMSGPLSPAIRAVDCLGYIGEKSIPALIMVATNPQPQNFRAMGWVVAFTNSETAMQFASQYAANPDFQTVFGRLPISTITNTPAQ